MSLRPPGWRWAALLLAAALGVLLAGAGGPIAANALIVRPVAASPERSFSFAVPAASEGRPRRVAAQVYVSSTAAAQQPATVLLAIHGMAGNGQDFSRAFLEAAEARGWVVVTPTIGYGNWRDPDQLRRDATELLPTLRAILAELPGETGLRLRQRVLLYGFSRGAQVAHRFAFFYPEQTLAVAALGSGTYTLPEAHSRSGGAGTGPRFPFGVSDLDRYLGLPFNPEAVRQVRFWVGVGALDSRTEDVPQVWDPYIGTCRTERAAAFAVALRDLGAPVDLVQFPDTGHQETAETRRSALAFLAAAAD